MTCGDCALTDSDAPPNRMAAAVITEAIFVIVVRPPRRQSAAPLTTTLASGAIFRVPRPGHLFRTADGGPNGPGVGIHFKFCRVRGRRPAEFEMYPDPDSIQQTAPGGLGDGGGARRDAELVEDVRDVPVDRVLADGKLRADLLVAVSDGDEPQDLELALRETGV